LKVKHYTWIKFGPEYYWLSDIVEGEEILGLVILEGKKFIDDVGMWFFDPKQDPEGSWKDFPIQYEAPPFAVNPQRKIIEKVFDYGMEH
jgi:hypothetical protein